MKYGPLDILDGVHRVQSTAMSVTLNTSKIHRLDDSVWGIHIGVSIVMGVPPNSWLVYSGKSHSNGWFGVPPFMETTWNHHIWFGYDIRCSFIPANFFLRVIPALKHYSDRYSFWLYHLKVEMAYLFRHSILHSFWHIPWHSIWHSIRHLCWHLCWHSLWRLAEVKQPPLTSGARGSFTGDDKIRPSAGRAGRWGTTWGMVHVAHVARSSSARAAPSG